MKELGAKVLLQKGSADEENENDGEEEEDEIDIAKAFLSANTVYYNITHTVK